MLYITTYGDQIFLAPSSLVNTVFPTLPLDQNLSPTLEVLDSLPPLIALSTCAALANFTTAHPCCPSQQCTWKGCFSDPSHLSCEVKVPESYMLPT